MNKQAWLAILCSGLCLANANAQTILDGFEYATDDDLLTAWLPDSAVTATLSDSVAPKATGKKSMKLEINFPSVQWATETVRGADLPAMDSIGQSQFITYRLRGDTNFANADYRGLYLYAYDDSGNFGRWGPAEPSNPDWQVINSGASSIGQPWDSPALPDLSRIVRFAWFIYGSQAAIDPYTATIYIDDLVVRDTALTEFPPSSAPRQLLDDFEGYKDDAAVRSAYTYQNSSATTVASLATPAPQGAKAIKLAIDFGTGQWPWGSVRSANVAPFSLPTNAVVSFRFKGDPALASVADDGTVFELSFYDRAGNSINYWAGSTNVTSSDWVTLQAQYQDFGDTTSVDVGNLVQWRLLVEGWTGTADSVAKSGTFYIDDLRVSVPSALGPSLAVSRDGTNLQFTLSDLTVGASYDVRSSPNLAQPQWTTATTITATATTATWSVKPDQPRTFFQLLQK